MSQKLYTVEFSGKIIPGWNIEDVKKNLAKLLKADENKIAQLFSGNRMTIKKNVDQQTAFKINASFRQAGADCELVETQTNHQSAPPPVPAKPTSTQSDHASAVAANRSLEPAEIRPGRWWYFIAIVLFLTPLIIGGIMIAHTVSKFFLDSTRLTVPGETTITAEEPGTYFIWYETSVWTEENISQYRWGQDFEIAMMDLATGEALPLKSADFGDTQTYNTRVSQAIAEVELDTSGDYYAEIIGEIPHTDGLLIRRFDLAGIIKGVISGILLIFSGFIIGPIAALAVLIKRQNFKRKVNNESISEDEERKWAMFAHIGTFSSAMIPLGNIIAPIVIWQLKKKESEFVVDQAKESLNFQISLMIYCLISFVLVFIIIGFFLIFALVIFSLIIVIVAGVRANDGEHYRYPMCLRLIR
jgi:uncharacterized Tic20 family protein